MNSSSPFAEDSSKLSSIVSHLPSVHHSRNKRQRRVVDDTSMPIMPMVNEVYPDGQFITNPSIMMSLQGIPVSQSMIQIQQIPLNVTTVLPTNQNVSQPPSLVQTVEPISLDQTPVDNSSIQHAVVMQDSIKQEPDTKNITFHLGQANDEGSGNEDRNLEMDVKRVKDVLYSV